MSHSTGRLAAAAAVVAAGGVLVVGLTTLGLTAAHTGINAPAAPVVAAAPLTSAAPATPVVEAVAGPTTTGSAASSSTTTPPTTSSTPTAGASSATVDGIPCDLPVVGDGACVDLSAQKAWLVSDGSVVRTASITTGKAGHRTPPGRFAVEWKDIDHVSKEFDSAPMPYSVFFHQGMAFHTGSLSEESHGCIHLSNSAARTFYSTLSTGDPVVVVR